MGAGKHSAEVTTSEYDVSKISKVKKTISFVQILVVFTILFVIVGSIMAVRIVLKNNEQEPTPTEPVSGVVPTLEEQYEGYEVLGKIKIDKLNVEQYILNSSEESALEKGVTKLYGGTLNDYGNFCIAGHNYEHIFERLNELEPHDTFTIINKDLSETEYEITEIISVEPDDLSVLLPNEEAIQITLITCENIATTRLVVKAEKK